MVVVVVATKKLRETYLLSSELPNLPSFPNLFQPFSSKTQSSDIMCVRMSSLFTLMCFLIRSVYHCSLLYNKARESEWTVRVWWYRTRCRWRRWRAGGRNHFFLEVLERLGFTHLRGATSHSETIHTFHPTNGRLPENSTTNLYFEQTGVRRPWS